MKMHEDYHLAMQSLDLALTRLKGMLDIVRTEEQARKDFDPNWDPTIGQKMKDHPKGPNKDDAIFEFMRTALYRSTGFKTGAPPGEGNPTEDGLPPRRAGDPDPGQTQAAQANEKGRKQHLSKRRRAKLSQQTEDLFRGIYKQKSKGVQQEDKTPPPGLAAQGGVGEEAATPTDGGPRPEDGTASGNEAALCRAPLGAVRYPGEEGLDGRRE